MYHTKLDMPAIRHALSRLKAAYPRKRGIRLFISASVDSWERRQHLGWVQWDGSARGLLEAKCKLLGVTITGRNPKLRLHLTHFAIAASDPAAEAAQADITAFVLGEDSQASSATAKHAMEITA